VTPPQRKLLLALTVLAVGGVYLPIALATPALAAALALGYIAVVLTAAVVGHLW
jgi:hypothetical protein